MPSTSPTFPLSLPLFVYLCSRSKDPSVKLIKRELEMSYKKSVFLAPQCEHTIGFPYRRLSLGGIDKYRWMMVTYVTVCEWHHSSF